MGASYRFGTPQNSPASQAVVDGYPNWFYVTDNGDKSDGALRAQSGIWNPKVTRRDTRRQVPLIICSSSPHKGGSADTPWADVIRPDDGYVLYYGDNKDPRVRDASEVRGNRLMLDAMRLHHSSLQSERELSPPVLVVTTHGESGLGKGYRRVEGVGVILRAEGILQRHANQAAAFQNLRFELAIFDLKSNHDSIPMEWINRRRRNDPPLAAEMEWAPEAWQVFVSEGMPAVDRLKRSVFRGRLTPASLQLPSKGSELDEILLRTIEYFDGSKHDFEAIAARVVERVFDDQGLNYRTGWLTPRSGDGGYDFVGRIDFDPAGGFPSSRQVVLGQAKCELSGTNGKDLARLAARLRRGWYGAYVTTSHFSDSVQKEVLEDKYPLLMVPGSRVASIIKDELDQSGAVLTDYLALTTRRFDKMSLGLADIEAVLLA